MSTLSNKNIEKESGLSKQLTTAQLGMIAIGGAIGTGLFYGSGFAISFAGPGVILSYLLSGLIAIIMIYCLCEMTVSQPTPGSFGVYAEKYVHPFAGFSMRYSYWLGVSIGIGTELIAIAKYMERWFPQVPAFLWIVLFAAVIFIVNATSVGNFGKIEFLFASIKVVAISGFIILGSIVLFGAADPTMTFANYTNNGGFIPKGFGGIVLGAFVAIFSYLSMEMIAVTAGEAKDPEVAVPRALKSVALRLLIFYIGALVVMLAMVPWESIVNSGGTLETSPFVLAFSKIGIPYAADLMNFVVLTAALSSINSMLYVASRMIFSLSCGGYAPAAIQKLTKNGVPINALIVSSFGVVVAMVVSKILPENVQFLVMMGLSMFGPLYNWLMIMVTHLFFRNKWYSNGGRKLPIKAPFFPYFTWLGILLLGGVTLYSIFHGFEIVWKAGIPWFAFLTIIYFTVFKNKDHSKDTERLENAN